MFKEKSKIIIASFFSFFIPLAGFLIIRKLNWFDKSYHNHTIHSLLLIIIAALSFYACYSAYRAYEARKDSRIFFVCLAFYVFGFSFSLHGIAVPDFYLFNEKIFDITEHYGLFLGSAVLLGLIIPWNIPRLHKNKTTIFFSLASFLLFSFLILIFIPQTTDALYAAVNFIIPLTGLFFFITLLFLISKYQQKKNALLFYLAIALSTLINCAIIPLFYEEWNILWWYFHLVFSSAFVIILIGLQKIDEKRGLENAFGEIPLYVKIGTKLVFFMIILSLVPLIATGFFVFYSSKQSLQKQIIDDLTALAYSKQGEVFGYLDTVEQRTRDFSSDGFIRDSLKEMTLQKASDQSTNQELANALNFHLKNNKQPLDENIFGINVIDIYGTIISSTEESEIGKNDANDEYFTNGLRGVYIAEMNESQGHFQTAKERKLAIAAPLTDKKTNEHLGVLVNFFKMEKLQKILTGEFQSNNNPLSPEENPQNKNTEIYVVDAQKRMFIHPEFLSTNGAGDARTPAYQSIVDTLPVRTCLEQNKSITDIYQNYRGEKVIGASMCVKDRGWIILTEKNQAVALAPIFELEQTVTVIIVIAAFLIIIIGLYLSGKLTKPIELLTETAQKISQGDLNRRATVFSNDEVGVLANSFNQMADNLVQEKEFPENIIRSMGDSLIATNQKMRIIKTNQATLELLGYSQNELVGLLLEKIIEPKELPLSKNKKFGELFNDGFSKNIEVNYLTKDGKSVPVNMSAASMRDHKGKTTGAVFIAKDIRIYKEVDRAKSEFISIAAHQLRTPLSIIKWTFRMLLDKDFGDLNAGQARVLSDSNAVTENMIKLVSDLLDVARIEEGRFSLKISKFKIEKIIDECILSLKPKMTEKKIEVKFMARGLLPEIEADYNKMTLIVENLIDNALKYSSVESIINIEAEVVGGNFEIRIKDQGIGIPQNQQDKIFTKFFRGSNAVRKETMGSGLGLYIVKNIAEMHGGNIRFISEENRGSTFYLNIPIKHSL